MSPVLGEPGGAAPAAAPPAPAVAEQPAPFDVTTADFPALLEELVDQYQTPEGRAPGAANGYGLLIRAGAILREVSAGSPPVDFTVLYDRTWKAGDGPSKEEASARARAVLKAAGERGVLELLDQVAAAPRMAMARVGTPERVSQERLALGEEPEKWSGRLVDMGLREFGLFRFLTRMSAARMAEARAAGDVAEFTRAAEHALAVARASTHQGGLIARLLGAAVQALTIDQVMIGVRVLKPSDAELAALAEVFRRQVGRLPPPRLAVGSERLLALDTCRVAFAADGKVDLNALGAITQTSLPAAAMPVVVRATREGNVAAVTDAYERLARWWDSPRAQRDQADSPDVVSERWRQDPQGLVVGLLLPAVERAAKVDDQVALRRQGVLAMLAVERYQRATGAYPADLAAVVAKRLLAAVPTDPVTGKPLGYRRLEKPDEAGRSYVLYSVGFDGVDDGGRELTEEQGGFTRAIQGPKVEGGADAVLTPGLR
ncbi:MAG: hypothetical protein LW650_05445 [Planctomycetaceae bacterium]|jgi:hypothetical protein|nr:hypothetical protein [Planctomycetaceae bacterium]